MVAVIASAAISNGIFFSDLAGLGPTVANDSLGGSSAWALIASMFGFGGLVGGVIALSLRPRFPLLVSEGLIVLFGCRRCCSRSRRRRC